MGLQHPSYKVAVVQSAPAWLNLGAAVEKTIGLIKEAAKGGAKLIAFPETWIPGYPWHIWLGSPAWAIGCGFVQRYFDNSLAYDSPQAASIAAAAKRHQITVILGLSERDGRSLYSAQWLIGPDGETITKRRKLRPPHVERTVFGEGDGSLIAVHDLPGLGPSAHCAAGSIFNHSRSMHCLPRNEQVHIAAWPSFSMYEPFARALSWETDNAISKVYAVEGSCFVLDPCALVSHEIIEEMCDTPRSAT